MGEKRDLVRRYTAKGIRRDVALNICGISKDQYYYKPNGRRPGRKSSRTTAVKQGDRWAEVPNSKVVEFIEKKLKEEFVDYGHRRMTSELQINGYKINHKKVYRLMKSKGLLRAKEGREGRNYVKYRVLLPEGPLRVVEMDIKQVWLEEERRNMYVLTILDVFDRRKLHQEWGYSMTQEQVQRAWQQVIESHFEAKGMYAWEVHIEVRSDNGPQFCAKKLQAFFVQNKFVRTFTHPYTPQENGHVESYHAILGKVLQAKGPFGKRAELERCLEDYERFYNYERPHGSLLGLPPMTFHEQWALGNIERTVLDERRRRVHFALKVCKTSIRKTMPAGNERQREACA